MQKLIILNTRKVKKIKEALLQNFDYCLQEDYAYLINERKRVFIINKDLSRLDLEKLRIDKIGFYFAEFKNNHLRLSKEGAQLLANEAKKNNKALKNVIDLNKEEMKEYFKGLDLEKDLGEENKFVLLKHDQRVFGCAKYKNGQILNFLPKIHRGEVIL